MRRESIRQTNISVTLASSASQDFAFPHLRNLRLYRERRA